MSIYDEAAQIIRERHRSDVTGRAHGVDFSWSCSCGKASRFPSQHAGIARAALDRHLRAEMKRILSELREVRR